LRSLLQNIIAKKSMTVTL